MLLLRQLLDFVSFTYEFVARRIILLLFVSFLRHNVPC